MTDVSIDAPRLHVQAAEAINFLEWLRPEGPWHLIAITPDKRVESKWFDRETLRKWAPQWIERLNADHNVYYQLNPTIDMSPKDTAKLGQIKSVEFLHADIDPRAGEDLAQERERIEKLLRSYNRKPSRLIFTGGGMQALYRLREPIPIDGDLERAEDAKLYNIALERALGGDNTHNINRILRLPGTINWPDEGKKRKGRVAALARDIPLDGEEPIYSIGEFEKAAATSGDSKSASAKVGPLTARHVALDELPQAVRDWVRVAIVQGRDPEGERTWASRSEMLYAVCCELVRAECDDATIYGIITDRDYRISESVLDKGRSSERYARRQIERARRDAHDPNLIEMNGRFAVINYEGKFRVMEWTPDRWFPRQSVAQFYKREDFCALYPTPRVEVPSAKPMERGRWWLAQDKRRQLKGIDFLPGGDEVVDGRANMWTGFAVAPRAGSGCGWWLAHVRTAICDDVPERFEYLMSWMARAVQRPAEVGYTTIVLRGGKGAGKGMFAKQFGLLFGQHFAQLHKATHITGRFNALMADKVVVFADEAFFAGSRSDDQALKMLTTEDSWPLERKGIDPVRVPNYVHLIAASNEQHIVNASIDERRYAVFDVQPERIMKSQAMSAQDRRDYFDTILDEMSNGGREALLHLLLHRDISHFDVRHIPRTEALLDQKRHSALSTDPVLHMIFTWAQDGRLPGAQSRNAPLDKPRAARHAEASLLYRDMRERGGRALRDKSDKDLHNALRGWFVFRNLSPSRRAGWLAPPLRELRERLRREMGEDFGEKWAEEEWEAPSHSP